MIDYARSRYQSGGATHFWKPSADIHRALRSAGLDERTIWSIGHGIVHGSMWASDKLSKQHWQCRRCQKCPRFLEDILEPFITDYALKCLATQKAASEQLSDRQVNTTCITLITGLQRRHRGSTRDDVAEVIMAAHKLTVGILGQTQQALDMLYNEFATPYHRLLEKHVR